MNASWTPPVAGPLSFSERVALARLMRHQQPISYFAFMPHGDDRDWYDVARGFAELQGRGWARVRRLADGRMFLELTQRARRERPEIDDASYRARFMSEVAAALVPVAVDEHSHESTLAVVALAATTDDDQAVRRRFGKVLDALLSEARAGGFVDQDSLRAAAADRDSDLLMELAEQAVMATPEGRFVAALKTCRAEHLLQVQAAAH